MLTNLLEKVELFAKKVSVRQAEQWLPGKEIKGVKVGLYKDPDGREFPAHLVSLEGTFGVKSGDMITTDPQGNIYAIDEKKFNNLYEHIKGNTFQTKPVLRHAVVWDGSQLKDVSPMPYVDNDGNVNDGNVFEGSIKASWGTLGINKGNMIIFEEDPKKNPDCARYPCELKIFEQTYEKANESKDIAKKFDTKDYFSI